jgi:hypothetical protein
MNCHVIIDVYMDAYVDDDVDTTSAHILTSQNLRWANFWHNFSHFRSSFLSHFRSPFQQLCRPNLSPIFNALFSPLLHRIHPIYTTQFRTFSPYTQPTYTAHTSNNCSSTSNKKYYVCIQHHITWIFIQHQIQHLAVPDIHQHTQQYQIYIKINAATTKLYRFIINSSSKAEICHQPMPTASQSQKQIIRHKRESWKPDD